MKKWCRTFLLSCLLCLSLCTLAQATDGETRRVAWNRPRRDDRDGCDGFFESGAVCKTSSRSSRPSRGAGPKVKGPYLGVEIAARQYNPNPLTFGPRRTLAGRGKGCAFPPAQRRVSKFRRGAGCPFQRAALLGEPSADGGGNAPTPPRRAQMRF